MSAIKHLLEEADEAGNNVSIEAVAYDVDVNLLYPVLMDPLNLHDVNEKE